jgi:hypothetical protein
MEISLILRQSQTYIRQMARSKPDLAFVASFSPVSTVSACETDLAG